MPSRTRALLQCEHLQGRATYNKTHINTVSLKKAKNIKRSYFNRHRLYKNRFSSWKRIAFFFLTGLPSYLQILYSLHCLFCIIKWSRTWLIHWANNSSYLTSVFWFLLSYSLAWSLKHYSFFYEMGEMYSVWMKRWK